MDVRRESEATPTKNRTRVERKSERELVVTRTVNAPARLVFEAWTKAELFRRWWVPKSYGLTLSTGAMPEALDQLDELLASLGSSSVTK